MNQNTQAESSPIQSLKVSRSSDFYVFFANYIRMRVAPGEFGFAFGFTDDTPEGSLTEEKMLVALSPQTAKSLFVALQAALSVYEQQNGPIKMAKNTPEDAQHAHKAISDAIQRFANTE